MVVTSALSAKMMEKPAIASLSHSEDEDFQAELMVAIADGDGDCFCLAVTDAPLRLTGRFGRLMTPFVRF